MPLPKLKGATEPKDFRPIALTPILAKCLEKLVAPHISAHIADSNQFAYKRNSSTDDALLLLLDKITNHLHSSAKNYVRSIFIDFSSVYNTINSNTLVQKMSSHKVNPNIVFWSYNFLSSRTQRVKVGNTLSNRIITSTGCPQGCVLSPILFSLYVDDMAVSDDHTIIKYADDTVILEFISPKSPSSLQVEINNIRSWCTRNSLLINTKKTKELVFCNLRDDPDPPPIMINNSAIERVDEYKYLGTTLNHKLNFNTNTKNIISKANKRLFIMKQLAFMNVKTTTIKLAYTSFLESVLQYHLCIIYGHLSSDIKNQYNHLINTARRLSKGRLEVTTIDDIFDKYFKTKCLRMFASGKDTVITLEQLPSGRYRVPAYRVNCRKYCFRSLCVKLLNRIA